MDAPDFSSSPLPKVFYTYIKIIQAMMDFFKGFFEKLFRGLFRRKQNIKLGLYGPPNGGKTTLANRICMDWLGEEMGSVSEIAHETREIQIKEQVTIKGKNNKQITFNLVDTPGIATKIDYEDFLKYMDEKQAKDRAKEATKGVIDAIKWLDDMDTVIIVLDSTKDPYTQVNITIIGNLQARNIPVVIAANKVDLKKSDIKRIQAAFPQYKVIGISARYGNNMDLFYEELINMAG
jgi:GTPase